MNYLNLKIVKQENNPNQLFVDRKKSWMECI